MVSLFVHSHVVNGVTIVHSHPFNKDVEHTHSTAEFQLIHHLSHVVITTGILFSFLLLFTPILLSVFQIDPDASRPISWYTGCISLRAPPFTIR